ncbi:tryptophan-rich sensory protein [Gammaproteobacteria bacterium]|nr:tryptophan-rich sensory protein [Gammaproteobacteria bacterium]
MSLELFQDFLEKDSLFLNNRYSIFLFTFLALILGGLSSSDTPNDLWYQELNKSFLNPPGYIFGLVWPILYFLMSISAYRTFPNTRNLFLLQLFFNAIWSWIFFAFHLPLLALVIIWLLIGFNIKLNIDLYKLDKLSAILFIPYIVWLFFASYLNLFIVVNN